MLKRTSPFTRLTAALAVTAAVLLGTQAQAQTEANLAPADTYFYLHMSQPSQWFGGLIDGPVGDRWREQMESSAGFGDLLAALDMDFDQFMAGYFDGEVVVVSPGHGEHGIIFTQVSHNDREHAIDSIPLTRQGNVAGYPAYLGPEGEGVVVMMDNWVALSHVDAADYLAGVLGMADDAPRLSDTPHYDRWVNELPANRVMTMLVNEGADNQHALGMVREGSSLDATYLGISPDYDELTGMLGEAGVAEFGPLPSDTIGAVSFNIVVDEEDDNQFQFLDAMLGASFADQVLPKLDPPTLMFMGSVDGQGLTPALTVDAPVVGLALHMNDNTAAADLDTIIQSGVAFLSLGVQGRFEQGLIPERQVTYEGVTFNVAELGTPVAQGTGYQELTAMQIVYGQIGDYYILCSHEEFFKQCIDASDADPIRRLSVEGPPHPLAQTPVMVMNANPEGFGTLMIQWVQLMREYDLPGFADEGEHAADPEDIDMVLDVAQLIQQYSLLKMQLWTGEDGVVVGRAELTPPR